MSQTTPQDDLPHLPSAKIRVMVSIVLLAHLAVVIIVPLSLPPSPPLVQQIASWIRPYTDLVPVSSGYAFFAANPGPSFLVDYELEFADGRMEKGRFPHHGNAKGRFPGLAKHRPRLRYHRHFMLSEQWAGMFRGLDPPPEPQNASPEVYQQWEQDYRDWRAFFDHGRSYARHLILAHGATKVRLYLIEHRIPALNAVLAGEGLDEDESYVPVTPEPIIALTREEIEAERMSP